MSKDDGLTLDQAAKRIQRKLKVSKKRSRELLLEAIRKGEIAVTGRVFCAEDNQYCATPQLCMAMRGCVKMPRITQ